MAAILAGVVLAGAHHLTYPTQTPTLTLTLTLTLTHPVGIMTVLRLLGQWALSPPLTLTLIMTVLMPAGQAGR